MFAFGLTMKAFGIIAAGSEIEADARLAETADWRSAAVCELGLARTRGTLGVN